MYTEPGMSEWNLATYSLVTVEKLAFVCRESHHIFNRLGDMSER